MKLKAGFHCCSFSFCQNFSTLWLHLNSTLRTSEFSKFTLFKLLMLLKAVDVPKFLLEVMYPRGMLFFLFDLLHALPSCVWADPLGACSPITHQPQLYLTKKKQKKTASSRFFCTCSALRCIASGK